VWAHIVEAFHSPLASDDIRREAAALARRVVELSLEGCERAWFEASGEAARLQASSSVGLVHGIAHVLEHPLRRAFPDSGWGHAKLCAAFLAPVMDLNREATGRWQDRWDRFGVDAAAVRGAAMALHDGEAFEQAIPFLERHWQSVLRDRCTRTNGVVVRPSYVGCFRSWRR
jgi:alcohol dehydrogenase class IV